MDSAIVVAGLWKSFRKHRLRRPYSLKEAFSRGFSGWRSTERRWVLRDVNLDVSPGRMVGVIGRNGSGKSTLLRMIGGVGRPDAGRVSVRGRIGALLDLGSGFRVDLTGRENLFIKGIIGGLTRREVAHRFDDIVGFSELEAYIDEPLRTYSTGMRMRLGFGVAIHSGADVLLIDEALAVGDVAFQNKCLKRIKELQVAGCTVFMVSHDLHRMGQVCDELLWMHDGRLMRQGAPSEVVKEYKREIGWVGPVKAGAGKKRKAERRVQASIAAGG